MEYYKEIFRLEEMLEKAGIHFEFIYLYDGYQIVYPSNKDRKCSVISREVSYSNSWNLLEIMGLLTEEESKYDEVIGYLSAEDVFERIKKDYLGYTIIEK